MILQTSIALLATNTRLTSTFTSLRITLRGNRSDWVTIAIHTAITERKTPHIITTRGAIIPNNTRLTNTLASLHITLLSAELIALAGFTGLGNDWVAPMPVGTSLAVDSGGVVETSQARARSLVARVECAQVDVAVALARKTLAVGDRRVAVEAWCTSLTELTVVARCACAVVDFLGVRVVVAAVCEDVCLVGAWTWTQTAFASSVAVLDQVVS
jgi:hypothetical protein